MTKSDIEQLFDEIVKDDEFDAEEMADEKRTFLQSLTEERSIEISLKTIEIKVDANVLAKFQTISAACDKSLNWIIERALKTYLLNEGQEILNAISGQKQIAAGDYEDIDDVIADMERIINGDLKSEIEV